MKRDDRNMRVAMFGQRGPNDPEGGGVEKVVTMLTTRMAKKNIDVTCYDRKSAVSCDNPKEYEGVRHKYVFTLNKKGLAAMTSSFFAAIRCAFGKYDVVHVHAEGPAFMCGLLKLFRKKVVCTVHGLDHQRAKWGKLACKYIMGGEKSAVKHADHIIVLSKGVQDYFQEVYGRETVFIPNGVEEPEILEANIITEKWSLTKDSYILFLGRIVPEKGLRYLISAWRQIETDKKLVIAGGSADTDTFMSELKAMADGDDSIIFTGLVKGKTLEELYSNAYVYTLPSDLEGMPLSLLEAMSFGNCVLTSDIPECREVVSDKGVTFGKSDVSDLSSKLKMLIDNPETVTTYKKMAAAYVLEKYDWDKVTDKTISLYEDNHESITG